MSKYRKKPIVIEAIQLKWENWSEICAFVAPEYFGGGFYPDDDPSKMGLIIKTLEGNHEAHDNDYIIKGVAGEFYPCKPEIFEQTYELVKED